MKLANNLNEFIETMEKAERQALNNELGQRLTKELLKMKLRENPNMTPEEWQQAKNEFMTFIFCKALEDFPELMDEFAGHVYDDIKTKTA